LRGGRVHASGWADDAPDFGYNAPDALTIL
jgi:hypothetical protein